MSQAAQPVLREELGLGGPVVWPRPSGYFLDAAFDPLRFCMSVYHSAHRRLSDAYGLRHVGRTRAGCVQKKPDEIPLGRALPFSFAVGVKHLTQKFREAKYGYSESMSSSKLKNSEIGKRIKKIRELQGLSQADMGARVGCTGGNISDIERGKSGGSGSLLQNILREFNVNEEWLTKGIGPIYKEDGVVLAEADEVYFRLIRKSDQRIVKAVDALLESGDKQIIDHLERQLDLLLELKEARRKK